MAKPFESKNKVEEPKPEVAKPATVTAPAPQQKKLNPFEQKMAEKKAAEEAAREAARKNPKPDPFKAKPFESKDRDLPQKDVGAPAEKKTVAAPVKKLSLFEQKMAEKKAAEEAAKEAARKNPKPDPYRAKAFESKNEEDPSSGPPL